MKGPKPLPYRAEGLEVPGSLISPPASLPSFPGGMGCHPETLSIRSTSGWQERKDLVKNAEWP